MTSYPIVYQQSPALERSRLTVLLRFFFVIPHYIWSVFYLVGAAIVVIISWFAILFTGRFPDGMYNFVAGYLRFAARLSAYAFLITDKYPPFDGGEHPEYPVSLAIPPPPEHLSRLSTFFRYFLLIPVTIIEYFFLLWIYAVTLAIWVVAIITGKTAPKLIGASRYPLSYVIRATAYAYLVTDVWPTFAD